MSGVGKGDDYRPLDMKKWSENYDRAFNNKDDSMKAEGRHSPLIWAKMAGVKIMDADGWRSDKKSLRAYITKDEFKKRLSQSTVSINDFEVYKEFFK